MDSQGIHPRLAYPVVLEEHQDTVLASFPDVPEALTEGATEQEALDEAADCLVAALGGYVDDGRRLPRPSVTYGGPVVELSVIATAKLALYQAMQDEHVGLATLAHRVGMTEVAANRLLDLDCRSHIDQVATALMALGRHLVVEIHTAA